MPASDENLQTEYRDRLDRRVLNPRAALICGAVVLALTVSVRQLHSRHAVRTTDFLHGLALQTIAVGSDREALTALSEYVALCPRDAAMKEQLSELLDDRIATPDAWQQAFRLNEELLRRDPRQTALRFRQARLAVKVGQYSAAESHLAILRSELPDSSEVFFLSGRVASSMRRPDEAEAFLNTAIALPRPVPDAFHLLAEIQPNSIAGRKRSAALMDQMVERNPCAAAYGNRADWLLGRGQPAAACDDVWRGLELAPDDARLVRLLVSNLAAVKQRQHHAAGEASAGGHLPRAIVHLRGLANEESQTPENHLHLARLLQLADQNHAAVDVLLQGLQLFPGDRQLLPRLAELYLEQNQSADARRLLHALEDDRELRATRHFLEGRILMHERRWEEAEQTLSRILASAAVTDQLRHRTQFCIALCRQQRGDRHAALELYRDLSASEHSSSGVLLGLASAYWDTDQRDLALSVWRRLVHLPEVASSLADALIQHNLSLPGGARDWAEVERLLRDEDPYVPDPVHRALLQADLQFAQGAVGAGMELLDLTQIRWPDRAEVRRALRALRVSSEVDILQRLVAEAAEFPDAPAAHVAILRLHVARNDLNQAEGWLRNISSDDALLTMSRAETLRLAVTCARRAEMRERHSGATRSADHLQAMAVRFARELMAESPGDVVPLMQLLSRSGQSSEAVSLLNSHRILRPVQRARGWLELVRYTEDAESVGAQALAAVYTLILQHPEHLDLRAIYAELLVWLGRSDDAHRVLHDVVQSGRPHPWSAARLAWIEALQGRQPEQPERDQLRTGQPSIDPALQVLLARIEVEAGEYERALELSAAASSAAAKTTLAAALVGLERWESARAEACHALFLSNDDPLLPEDERLLQTVMEHLEPDSRAER